MYHQSDNSLPIHLTASISNFCATFVNRVHASHEYKSVYNNDLCNMSSKLKSIILKVEECNEPSCEALIFPYGVVLFNIFSTICI